MGAGKGFVGSFLRFFNLLRKRRSVAFLAKDFAYSAFLWINLFCNYVIVFIFVFLV